MRVAPDTSTRSSRSTGNNLRRWASTIGRSFITCSTISNSTTAPNAAPFTTTTELRRYRRIFPRERAVGIRLHPDDEIPDGWEVEDPHDVAGARHLFHRDQRHRIGVSRIAARGGEVFIPGPLVVEHRAGRGIFCDPVDVCVELDPPPGINAP